MKTNIRFRRNGLAVACCLTLGWMRIASGGVTNYVSSVHGDDTNSGADWANAWATLTNAVAQSVAESTVILSNGVYTLGSQLLINKALTLRGFGEDPEDVAITPESGRVDLLQLAHADAVVENLTVRDGRLGIHLNGAGTVRGCIIRNCGYHRSIQGVYLQSGGLVENSVIRDCNGADAGGGVRIHGAGILRNSLVTQNRAAGGNNLGGGLYISGTGGLVENCTIVRNESVQGGGVFSLSNAGTIRNSIVMFNRAPDGMNLHGNPVVDDATILSPAHTRTGTTRAIDPQFVDFENENYRPRPGSPAIDAGEGYTGDGWMTEATDLDGNPRLSGTVDVGAYEYVRGALAVGLHPSSRSGFMNETEIIFSAAAEGTNTSGVVYTWDFNNNGTPDAVGSDKAVVTHVYATAGHKTVRLTIENAANEQTEHLFENAVKIGPRTVYAARGTNSDTYPYVSWNAAASNLQSAVNAAVEGSVVRAGAGTYLLTDTLVVREDIVLESATGAADTIIDGQLSVTCLQLDPFEDRVTGYLAATVDGFTIRNGYGIPAGVALLYGGILRNSVISNNLGTTASTSASGGVWVLGPGSLVEHCWIIGNRGERYGNGAGYILNGGTVRNSLVYGNWTRGGTGNGVGGLSFLRGGLVENCTIVGNYSPNASGAGGLRATISGTVRNSIVYFNKGDNGAVDNILSGSFSASSTDNIVATLVANVSGTQDDPKFIQNGNLFGENHVPGDYRLQTESPAVDQGSFQTWMTGAVDLDGNPRIYGAGVDIGAFEWLPPAGTLLILR